MRDDAMVHKAVEYRTTQPAVLSQQPYLPEANGRGKQNASVVSSKREAFEGAISNSRASEGGGRWRAAASYSVEGC